MYIKSSSPTLHPVCNSCDCSVIDAITTDVSERMYRVCSACLTTAYCSKTCQIKDWPTHRQFCVKREPNPSSQETESQECDLSPLANEYAKHSILCNKVVAFVEPSQNSLTFISLQDISLNLAIQDEQKCREIRSICAQHDPVKTMVVIFKQHEEIIAYALTSMQYRDLYQFYSNAFKPIDEEQALRAFTAVFGQPVDQNK